MMTETPTRAMSAEKPTRANEWNPPAQPGEDTQRYYYGMTLRDWFAGQALAGLCGNPRVDLIGTGLGPFAEDIYRIADAMLDERQKAPEGK